jgi:hypothetical protein
VPLVDRYYSLSRERLFAMVHAVIWEQVPDRTACGKEWLRVFGELVPPDVPDRDGLAVAQEGIRYLRDELGLFLDGSQPRQDGPLNDLHRALEQLLTANQEFALLQQTRKATDQRYNDWRSKVVPLIERIVELSYGRIVSARKT